MNARRTEMTTRQHVQPWQEKCWRDQLVSHLSPRWAYAPDAEMWAQARELARVRVSSRARQHSPTRVSSARMVSQVRGALGELVAWRALVAHVPGLQCPFVDDNRGADLMRGDRGIEVMTAMLDHRAQTGFCVPPNKVHGSKSRAVRDNYQHMGYLFVTLHGPDTPGMMKCWLHVGCSWDEIASSPRAMTSILRSDGSRTHEVDNHVLPADFWRAPESVVAALSG